MLELHGYSRAKSRQALDIWNRFCSVIAPQGMKPTIWAAALEYAVTKYGPHFTQKQLADEYRVSVSKLGEHYHAITEAVDLDSLINTDFLDEIEKEGSGLYSLVRREEMPEVIATIAGRPDGFNDPGEVCSWVFDRIKPLNETEHREIEDFLSYLWKRK